MSKLLQVVTAEVGKVTTTTQIPTDDTTPQNTEGGELITATITPTAGTSNIIIRLSTSLTHSAGGNSACCLFKDSDASAIGVHRATTTLQNNCTASWVVAATDTSARTYKIRFGANVAGTLRNYNTSADDEGGLTNLTTLTLYEVAP